jgi:predicted nucleic-acid-binding Zn-ribbon protein
VNEDGCPTCGGDEVDVGTISTTGSGLSELFDIQTNNFQTVTCTSCGYTELYADADSRGADLADSFFG